MGGGRRGGRGVLAAVEMVETVSARGGGGGGGGSDVVGWGVGAGHAREGGWTSGVFGGFG